MTDKQKEQARQSTRYPYTYAYDYLRYDPEVSRSQMGAIMERVATALGVNKEGLYTQIAEYYFEHEEALTAEAAERLTDKVIFGRVV